MAFEVDARIRLLNQQERFMKDIKSLAKSRGKGEKEILLGSMHNYLLDFELYLASIPKRGRGTTLTDKV